MTKQNELYNFPQSFQIRNRKVGQGQPCLIVAEVSQAHEGSLGTAHAFIDAIAGAGADAVKFQTHIAEAESTPQETWRVPFSPQDKSRYDYWKRMEFSEAQWSGLCDHAHEKGLEFISSPFSIEAVDLLIRVGVKVWKVASGEVSNRPLLEHIIRTGLPILLSTGMSPLKEIDNAVAQIGRAGLPLAVLQCTSSYPCPPEEVGLNLIPFFKQRYNCPVGLSDHSGTIFAGLAAATIGIGALEVHVTFSKEMFGPDVPVSVTMTELRQLVEGVRTIERMVGSIVEKDRIVENMVSLRKLFTQSVVTAMTLPVGTILTREHLATRKPGTGIPAVHLNELVGCRLARSKQAHQLLSEEDIERRVSWDT